MTSPMNVLGLSQIMRRAFAGDDLSGLMGQLSDQVAVQADDAGAILDISTILQIRNQTELALELQSQALRMCQHYCLSTNPARPAIRLLALMAPGVIMDNTPLEFLVEQSDIALELLYLGEGLPVPYALPEHDVAFVAVCQSDHHANLLENLSGVMQHWPRPFINRPSAIAALARDCVAQRLADLPGVLPSQTMRLSRAELESLVHLAEGPADMFPMVARPLDSHAGHNLSKINGSSQLSDYLDRVQQAEYFVAPFIDYRSHDGRYRKNRLVVIDGQPLAAHMAVSERWMVHYLNADMLSSVENRFEEARFMAHFDRDFAQRHRVALQAIDRRLGLDYYSIDCAETTTGQLVVFEVDSGAVVHSMDPVELFPYKAPQMQRVFSAFRTMLAKRMASRTSSAAA